MVRKLSLILLALVLVLPVACAQQAKAPEQPLQVYSTEMENQGFTNALVEVEEKLKKNNNVTRSKIQSFINRKRTRPPVLPKAPAAPSPMDRFKF